MQEISVSRADISLLRYSRWIRLTKSIYNNKTNPWLRVGEAPSEMGNR